MTQPSKIFCGYRALGFVSNHVPLCIRYIVKRKENLVNTVVGKCFHTYGCDKLTLLSVSNAHMDEIGCLASDSYMVYTSCKSLIYAWRRGTEMKHMYKGHTKDVHLMMTFGPHLLSVDRNNTLILWDIKAEEIVLELDFDSKDFCISAMVHPSTYLNKILLGSQQGTLELRNILTNEVIFRFPGWGAAVLALEDAPSVDVAAIGLSNGEIYVHNLKFNETIAKFCQEWGSVLGIAFCTVDSMPLMATASPVGHIAIWDLEKRRLQSEIREAHKGAITGMKFLPNEPLLITSSPDNTLKMWIFDNPDESGRLLKFREGHSRPPLKIRFHGSSGKNIISAGFDSTLRSFSTAADNLNKNLGQASYNRKLAKKKGINHDHRRLPPIFNFSSELAREKDWDNIAVCHRGLSLVTTWSYDHCRMGDHKLLHDRFKGEKQVYALCVILSSCGNFVLIGYSSGHIDKFNIQSGLFRGTFGKEKAHSGAVRGLVTDGLNQIVVSGGSDKILKFWKFHDCTPLSMVDLESSVSQMIIHRESCLIAVAMDNFSIIVVDHETRRIVRIFEDNHGQISDMTFSPDSRWLIVASMDSTIKTWDLPTGCLMDCFTISPVCISLTMSPTSDYLATVHTDDVGIYLWSNTTLYTRAPSHSLPADHKPKAMQLPVLSLHGQSAKISEEDDDLKEEATEMMDEDMQEFISPEQIADDLVTLSLVPNSHWRNLLNLDVIKMRNKPKEPVKVPRNGPFFLPVVSGLKPTFSLENQAENQASKKKGGDKLLQQHSSFAQLLLKCDEKNSYGVVIEKLKSLSPSLIDIEIMCLSPTNGGSIHAMMCFLKAMDFGLKTNTDFEVLQSYLGLFLQVHNEIISTEPQLWNFLEELRNTQSESWKRVQSNFNQCICLVNYLRSAVV